MASATLIHKTTTTELALAITGRTIDIGERDEVPATVLRLTYRNAEITDIAYDTIEGGSKGVAGIHPSFLRRPEAWPAWVRELVDQHRPTG